MPFNKYYQSELTYLRDMGRLFAEANPTIAGLLAERGTDPDVERLLEGFAFLTARMRERIDDSVPEIIHAMSELLAPHYLRAIPAASVVEFAPQTGALRGRHKVPRGTPLGAEAVRGTVCSFRTTADTDLLPLSIENVVVDDSRQSAPVLHISFRSTDKGLPAVFEPAGIRLFFSGEYALGSTLMLWFLRFCRRIELTATDDSSAEKGVVLLPPDVIKPAGFDPRVALLPWPRFAPQGYRYLQEYFALPAKFLFVDITGLDTVAQAATERFTLSFHFERPPALPTQVGKQSVRLHCVPAINLFSGSANPVRKSPIEHEHLLTAMDVNPAHMEVYSVDGVRSPGVGQAEPVEYPPFFGFAHADEGRGTRSYYALRRCLSPIDGGVDTYFSIQSPRDLPPDTGEQIFSIDATFTNRFTGAELIAGQINRAIVGSPAMATFKNITEVTKPVPPPLGSELYWRLIAHAGLNTSTLSNPENLRAILELYNFQAQANQAQGRQNRLRAESVQGVEATPARRVLNGMPVRGAHTRIEVMEDRFASEGDAFLFGAVLNELCADRVTLNAFSEVTLKLRASQTEYHWLPRAGAKSIL